jgi:glutamate synthase domain-containing protein 1
MCGIVGLHLRNPKLHSRLGELLSGMLCEMHDRGADSAGVAVYGDPRWSPPGHGVVTLLDVPVNGPDATAAIGAAVDAPVRAKRLGEVLLLTAPVDSQDLLMAAKAAHPDASVAGFGADLTVLKGVGSPRALAQGWELASATGWQGVGHTRMATESAVTPAGSHPFAVGPSQCLVHNGSFSNHATIRRELRRAGVHFDSENDTEVGARFVAHQIAKGRSVETALKELCATFDGFYTLLVSNHDSFAVVRDSIACKPAVIAETEDWVAMASEYRALAHLPGVQSAQIWEPEPEVVYAWTR